MTSKLTRGPKKARRISVSQTPVAKAKASSSPNQVKKFNLENTWSARFTSPRWGFIKQHIQHPNSNTKGLRSFSFPLQPFILDGFKFDLRIYVLVTSCDPFSIFMFKEGLARFCTTRYNEPTHNNVVSNVYDCWYSVLFFTSLPYFCNFWQTTLKQLTTRASSDLTSLLTPCMF